MSPQQKFNFAPVLATSFNNPNQILNIFIGMTISIFFTIVSIACAQDQIFTLDPVWRSVDWHGPEATLSAAFGDADRDGNLDMLVGMESIHLFQNDRGPTIYKIANYTWEDNGNEKRVVLGDLDLNGYIDIAWAGDKEVPRDFWNGIILNHDGNFDAQSWLEWNPNRTFSIALGDVDGDSDLDVVVGGMSGVNNRLYLNDGSHSIIGQDPVWMSDTGWTSKIVFGDVDNDGDLDLLCGDGYFYPATLFLNRWTEGDTAVFNYEPDRVFERTSCTTLALGDLDGDGDLDLVTTYIDTCIVNMNRFNEGSHWQTAIFDDMPAWMHVVSTTLRNVVLGDVDKDGDLDIHICTGLGEPSRLFLNTGGPEIFEFSPTWEFDDGFDTHDLVLGDVDNDGDLDLLSVNNLANQGANLYLNQSPVIAESPSEPMILTENTWSLDLGDINSDGHTDLVCGNDGLSRLYLGSPLLPDLFSPISQWNNQYPATTRYVVLFDVTGDGNLDLVCGNYFEANTMFTNTGESFSALPAWFSDHTEPTTSLAFGDVDGDGDPDLVCGNFGAPIRLYRNSGGVLESFSSWNAGASYSTRSVDLGDVDGDGYLDLVCGNEGQANTLYLSEGGVLSRQPDWYSRRGIHENATWSVALGDVNGDGFLDLVCGNNGQSNTLYFNSNGRLAEDPAWISQYAAATRSVELHDVDGDGDLDLLCGNQGSPNTIYINMGGIFTGEPAWYSADTKQTAAVTAGDLDKDGDWDLVCGNEGQVNTIYYGQRNPVYQGDPSAPTNHLPHNPTYVEDVTIHQPAPNLYRIQFTAFDIESDPFFLLPQYRYKNESILRPIGDGNPLGPFAASPAGSALDFDFDISILDRDQRDVVLGLYVINNPQSVGIIRQNTTFHKDIGPLNIRRAEIYAFPDTVVFSGVALGDTVHAILSVTNAGNEVLNVSGFELPSTEMWHTDLNYFEVQPSDSYVDTLFLGPREELNVDGDLLITSNAPLAPTLTIPIRARIYPLSVRTDVLIEGYEAILGEALTVQVIPSEQVNIERCALLYRALGSGESFTAIELVPREASFTGVIPGQDVTEAGLEYYIELENSGVFATDPPDTAGGQFFSLAVSAPALITTQPLPTSGTDYLEGREIAVQVSLDQGVVYEQGTLNYRRGGNSEYTSIPILDIEPLPVATIPDSVVGPRGVEYWVEVQTSTSSLTDPPTNPSFSPRSIRVRVADLVEPDTHAGFQYRMVSVPLDFGIDFTGTLESLLSDQSAFGPYPAERPELGQWRCFRGFPPEGNYLELPVGAPGDFRVEPGRGFWLISRDENWIATSPVAGTSTPTNGDFEITLAPGWNMVGHPFVFAVAWDLVLVDGQPPGAAAVEGPWFYDGTPYVEATLLEPFAGYWIRNSTDPAQDLVLSIPPKASPEGLAEVKDDDQRPSEDILWHMTIMAECAGVQDGTNRLGVITSASDTWDRYDRHEPPPTPERSLSLYFSHGSWRVQQGNYTVDYRSDPVSAEEGLCWRFDVAKNFAAEGVGDEVVLNVDGIESLPAGTKAVLVDNHLGSTTDLLQSNNYRYFCGYREYVQSDAEARFQLLVGSEEYVSSRTQEGLGLPSRMALLQNRPNPFNPATVIRYDIAQPGQVRLRVYDLSGALVRKILNEFHDIGRYETVWRGYDDSGRQVSSGVYFYRLESSDFVDTKRMTLIR